MLANSLIMSSRLDLLKKLKEAAAGGLADSSFPSVVEKLASGYYDDGAININTGKRVSKNRQGTYVYQDMYYNDKQIVLAINKYDAGDASYDLLTLLFNWYVRCLNAGRRLDEVDIGSLIEDDGGMSDDDSSNDAVACAHDGSSDDGSDVSGMNDPDNMVEMDSSDESSEDEHDFDAEETDDSADGSYGSDGSDDSSDESL